MNVLAQIAVAAAYGVDRLRADGVPIDRDRFNDALKLLAALSRLIDSPSPFARMDETRKKPDDGGMVDSSFVAARVGVTRSAVTHAARTGQLVGVRGGDGWRFTLEAVKAWEATRGRR